MKELIDVLPIGAVVSKQPLGNTTVGDFLSMNGDRLDAFCKLRKGNRSLFSLIKLQYEMRPQMCHLGFDGRIEYYDKDGIPQEDTSIENMQLSKRAHNCLYKSHYLYCSQLIGFKEEELLRISQLGKQTAQEIIDKVKQYTTCELLKPIEEMANVIQPIDDDEANINESTDDNLIETLDLSARAYNCLKRAGIDTIAQLAALSEDTLLHLKNMGAKSARETIAKLTHYREQQQGIPSSEQQAETRMEGAKPASATHAVQYLAKRIQDEGFTDVVRYEKSMDLTATAFVHTSSDGDFLPDRDGNALYIMFLSTLQVSNELQRAITEKLAANPILGTHRSDTVSSLPFSVPEEVLCKTIAEMERCQRIFTREDQCAIRYPTLEERIAALPKEREQQVVRGRLSGKTLEELGSEFSLTRERIRQIEVKAWRRIHRNDKLQEDTYSEVFCKYAFDAKAFTEIFDEPEMTYRYLKSQYKEGLEPLHELLNDERIPSVYKSRALNVLGEKYLFIDGNRLPIVRTAICDYILRKECEDEISFDSFVDLYNSFLKEHGLSENAKLEMNPATYCNRFSESRFVLWKQNAMLRYYDIDAYSYDKLYSALSLQQYKDADYSTLKLLREHPDLMDEYDIRDEYELHNLLKKTASQYTNLDIEFSRMPIIRFGNSDRERQVMEMLEELSPVSREDLAIAMEEKYGIASATIMANWLECIDKYYQNGLYSIAEREDIIGEDILGCLRTEFDEDFYYLSEVKEMLIPIISTQEVLALKPYHFRKLGYKTRSNYIYKETYNSINAYFQSLLLQDDSCDISGLFKRFGQIQGFYLTLQELCKSYQLIKCGDYQYMNIRKLEDENITVADLKAFCDEVSHDTDSEEFFTIRRLQIAGGDYSLFSHPFQDAFFAAVLEQDGRFSKHKLGGATIFKKGGHAISSGDFITYVVNKEKDKLPEIKEKSISISILRDFLVKQYGVVLDRWKIIDIIRNTDLVYVEEVEVVYANYMALIEDVGTEEEKQAVASATLEARLDTTEIDEATTFKSVIAENTRTKADETMVDIDTSEIWKIFSAPDMAPFVLALIDDGITTSAQVLARFEHESVWKYLNRHQLFSLRERLKFGEDISKTLTALKSENTGKSEGESATSQSAGFRQPAYAATSVMQNGTWRERTSKRKEQLGATIDSFVKDCGIKGCTAIDVAKAVKMADYTECFTLLEQDPRIIALPGGRFVHGDAVIGLAEARHIMQEILTRQFRQFNGYSSEALLYEACSIDADFEFFMNDNGFEGSATVYTLAQHFFNKEQSAEHRYIFPRTSSHSIWQDNFPEPQTIAGLLLRYARQHDGILYREETEQYLQSAKIKYNSLNTALKISNDSDYYQYDTGVYLLKETINMLKADIVVMRNALDLLLQEENFVILRDIADSWFALLPSLPQNMPWTPLLLQEVIASNSDQLPFRTIPALPCGSQDLDTIHVAIVPNDSFLTNFADVVHLYLAKKETLPMRFSAETLRIKLREAGMIAGNELYFAMPKALNDHRFAWDPDGKNVMVLEG